MGFDSYTCEHCCEAVLEYCCETCGKGFCEDCFNKLERDGDKCGYCIGEYEEYVKITKSKKEILDIVMKYAEKYRDYWGIKEAVARDDNASADGITLFGEIIGALSSQNEDIMDKVTLDKYLKFLDKMNKYKTRNGL